MKTFIKSLLVSMISVAAPLFSATQSFALSCNDLYTGTTVEDHFSSGKIKKLQSIDLIPSEYGDSSPVPTVLVKTSAVKSADVAKLSLDIYLFKGKQKQLFNKFTAVSEWTDNNQYYSFTDYDHEKLNQAVFTVGEGAASVASVSKIELQLKIGSKVVCQKQMHVDNH